MFFDLGKTSTGVFRKRRRSDSQRLDEYSVPQCELCKLYKSCLSPKMPPTGEGKKRMAVIAEAPGKTEDERNKQLVGESGQLFRKILLEFGYSLDRDFWKTNAICCRPPKNRTPTMKEIKYCRPNVVKFLDENKPKLVLLLGETAVKSVIGMRYTSDTEYEIGRWRGFVIPDRRFNCWFAPLFHPAYLLRNEKNQVVFEVFMKDLEYAFKFRRKPLPFMREGWVDERKAVKVVWSTEFAISLLKKILREARDKKILLSFDYETTGLKPHAAGHKIVCVSVCWQFNRAYSFPFFDSPEFRKLWKRVLTHPNILKTAHNLKYEDMWTYHILGFRPEPWVWCSLVNAHILDNRPKICGLKFQAYVHFGIDNYDKVISVYLNSPTSNGINMIDSAPKNELLEYCAIDSLVQFRLAQYQMVLLNSPILSEIANNYSEFYSIYL